MSRLVRSIIVALLILVPLSAWATQNAATCSIADINTAITAASAGETVNVPKGACDWGTSALTISKAVVLKGAGSGSSGTCDDTQYTCISGTGRLLTISTGSASAEFALDMSGFYFNSTVVVAGQYGTIGDITGDGYGWRIHDNYFYHPYVSSPKKGTFNITSGSHSTLYGLLDKNYFRNIYWYLNNSTPEAGWTAAADWGGANNVFFENNTFDSSDSDSIGVTIDNQNGGRAVVRYNIFYDNILMIHSACETTVRGGRSFDVYNNIFYATNATVVPYYIWFRAGSGRVTKNYVAGKWTWGETYKGYIALDNRRSWFDSSCTAQLGNCNGESANDTNMENPDHGGAVDGYRCLDQPGAGAGAKGSQSLDPIYVWSNGAGKICLSGVDRYKACSSNGDCVNADCSTTTNSPDRIVRRNNTNNAPYHIVSARDYYDVGSGSNTPGTYSQYTCPHPLADPGAAGYCDSEIAGTSGYNLDTGPPPASDWAVLATGDHGCSIAPTQVTVADGNTQGFAVSAINGAYGVSVSGCGGSLVGSTYTTGAITAACTVTCAGLSRHTVGSGPAVTVGSGPGITIY